MSSSSKGDETSLHNLHRSIVTVYVGPEKYPFYFHKGRLCQHSSFFEKAFHGSFEEATTGSIYLEEDGVDEVKLFEEWLYSNRFTCPTDSDDPSLLLVKVFCFAEKVGISALQNVSLDAIRDRATGQSVHLPNPDTTYQPHTKPPNIFGFQTPTTRLSLEEPVAKYLPPATASAIHYAYQYTPERSPLRKLLTDIFAFNVKPETLDEDILSFPAEFMANVLLINMKRLPLRLKAEEADFDKNADKYHVHGSPSTRNDRVHRTSEDAEVGGTEPDADSRDGPIAEAALPEPEPEPIADAPAVDEDNWAGLTRSLESSSKKKKKKAGQANWG